MGTRTRPLVSRLNISPLSSAVDVIEIVYDIYAISNSGPPRDAYIVTLYKVAEGEDIQIHERVLTLTEQRQEETAFRFTLTKSGEVADINELPKSLIRNGLAGNP